MRSRGKAPSQRPGQPGGARERNRRKRREQIESAALVLFLKRGVSSVTIEHITTEAGVAKGSFYRYYDSKSALIQEMYEPFFAVVNRALTRAEERTAEVADSKELVTVYSSLAVALLPLLGRPDHIRLYLQEVRNPDGEFRAMRVALEEAAIKFSQAAIDHGVLRDVGSQTSGLAVLGALETLLLVHLEGRLSQTPLQAVTNLIEMVMSGLAPK